MEMRNTFKGAAAMLELREVGKWYKQGTWALREVSVELKSGITGLLGPNGAGKSTLMRMMATISKPTEGVMTWEGADIARAPEKLRATLGYLPQDFGVYPHLSPMEFLSYAAAVKGYGGRSVNARIMELLELLNLEYVRKRPIGSFSGGMRQRVGIAQALLGDPRLLILDEPTVGLDPEERIRLRNLLTDMAGERTIVFSTHIVSDIEATADQIAILAKGRLIVKKDTGQILRMVKGKVWTVMVAETELERARSAWTISGMVRREEGLELRVLADEPPSPHAAEAHATLEDAYLYVSGGGG